MNAVAQKQPWRLNPAWQRERHHIGSFWKTSPGRYRPRQNQRLQAHPDERTLAINQTLQGQRAGGRFELGSWPLRSTEPNPSVLHSCREVSGTTPRACSARRSSSSRAGMTPTDICTSSPSSRTSFTGFGTTWWTSGPTSYGPLLRSSQGLPPDTS
jgi:hypothetical protein